MSRLTPEFEQEIRDYSNNDVNFSVGTGVVLELLTEIDALRAVCKEKHERIMELGKERTELGNTFTDARLLIDQLRKENDKVWKEVVEFRYKNTKLRERVVKLKDAMYLAIGCVDKVVDPENAPSLSKAIAQDDEMENSK